MLNSGRLLSAFLVLGVMVFLAGCESDKPAGSGNIPAAWDNPGTANVPGNGAGAPGWGDGSAGTGAGDLPTEWGAGSTDDSILGIDGVRPIRVEGFPVVVYFGYDTDRVTEGEMGKIAQVAGWINSQPGYLLVIEGHCDERGTEEYNRALGERRAIAVENALTAHGVDLARIRTVSYGKDRPAVSGSGEAVWSKNRRAQLWVGKSTK